MASYTILHVDDDNDDIMVIREAFEKYTEDLKLIHATNGLEALKVLDNMEEKNMSPCLIIMDINMPIMDGKEVLKIIKATDNYKDIPVVMFSTSTNQNDKKFAENLGADFISKPMRYTEVEQLVIQFVDKCRFEVENNIYK